MKKVILLIMASLLLTGCSGGSTTYNGSAKGYGGDVKVQVKVNKDGKIEDIGVEAPNETATVGGEAAPKVVQNIIDNQTLDVDTVTGATVTSNAVINAVNDALKTGNVTFDGIK